jgi:phage terminase large subunit-like protein
MDFAKQLQTTILKSIFNSTTVRKKIEIERPKDLYNFIIGYNKYQDLGFDFTEFFYKHTATEINNFIKSTKIDLLFLEAPPSSGKTAIIRFASAFEAVGEDIKPVLTAPQYLFVFGSQKLKKDFVSKIRDVLNSDYIKSIYGNQFNKPYCVNNEERLTLTNGVSLLFTTPTSESPTGTRFKRIYLIDYLTASSYQSIAKRDRCFNFLSGFLTRTQLNPKTKILVDNQRLGANDLTEYLQNNYNQAGVEYKYLRFPYVFKDEWLNIASRDYGGYCFKENEYLLNRFNESTEKKEIANIGSKMFKIQYQGVVDGISGDIIESIDLVEYGKQDFLNTNFTKLIISVDTALKAKTVSDWSVIALYGFDGKSVYLIDLKRGKWLFNEFEAQLQVFLEKWKNGIKNNVKHKYIDLLKIEDTAQGAIAYNAIKGRVSNTAINISNILEKYYIKDEAFNPKQGKYERLSAFLPFIKTHKIYIPALNYNDFVEASKVIEFKKEMLEFTATNQHRNDDMVDTFIASCESMYIQKPMINVTIS